MPDHLRIKSPFSELAILMGLLGICLIVTYAVSSIALVMSGLSGQLSAKNWEDPAFVRTMKNFQAVSSISVFLLPAVLYGLIVYRRRPLYHMGLRRPVHPSFYWMGILCMLASFPVVNLLGEINHALPLPQWMVDLEKDTSRQLAAFLKADNIGQIIVNVCVMALLPALGEELAFRGALQKIMIRLFRNGWVGIVVTAVLFSALHMQFLGFLPRVFLGVVLGAIYWFSGSLWTTILAHFIYNGVQVVGVAYAPQYVDKNPQMPIYFSLVGLIIVITLIWTMSLRNHDR